MKTHIFRDKSLVGETFVKHLQICADLRIPEEVEHDLAIFIRRFLVAQTSKQESEVLAELRSKWSLSPENIEALMGIGSLFLRDLGREDRIDDVLEDLQAITQTEASKIEKLRPLLELFLQEAQNFRLTLEVYSTQCAALKTLSGVTRLSELRAVIPNRDELDDDPHGYKPVIERLVPVGILRLRLDEGDPVVFQVDYSSLDLLFREVLGLRKEMDALIASWSTEKIHRGREREDGTK